MYIYLCIRKGSCWFSRIHRDNRRNRGYGYLRKVIYKTNQNVLIISNHFLLFI